MLVVSYNDNVDIGYIIQTLGLDKPNLECEIQIIKEINYYLKAVGGWLVRNWEFYLSLLDVRPIRKRW